MLVKHNLSTFFKASSGNTRVWDNGVDLKFEGDTIVINRLKVGGLAFVSLNNNIDLDMPIVVKFIVDNINGSSLSVNPNGMYKHTGSINSNTIGEREHTIAGFKDSSFLQLQIRPTSNEECRIKIYGIRVSTGEKSSDIYLPNINTLPTNKQGLLPPEGEYKEIQAL